MSLLRAAWKACRSAVGIAAAGAIGLTCAQAPSETDDDGSSCPGDDVLCDGGCVDVQSDRTNCGACGNVCLTVEVCNAGVCDLTCTDGTIECGGNCVNILSDTAHCGTCDAPCDQGQVCNNGTCECTGTEVLCDGACVNPLNNTSHCGSCNNACDADYGICTAGNCALNCGGAGLTECSGACVDTNDNQTHCGDCNNTCGTGQTCTNGSCLCDDNLCGSCFEGDMGNTVPATASGTTAPLTDGLQSGICFSTGGNDAVHTFTVPEDGLYGIDTIGSGFDTVMHVYTVDNMTCTESDCDDDTAGSNQSFVALNLTMGQEIAVVVDGYDSSDSGTYTINIDKAPACPGPVLTTNTTGSTVGAGRFYEGTCDGEGPEIAYSYTAAAAGDYTFDTEGSSYDTVIHVRDVDCNGTELACDDDGGTGTTSTVTVTLAMNQTVVVFVDSFGSTGGDYNLNVTTP